MTTKTLVICLCLFLGCQSPVGMGFQVCIIHFLHIIRIFLLFTVLLMDNSVALSQFFFQQATAAVEPCPSNGKSVSHQMATKTALACSFTNASQTREPSWAPVWMEFCSEFVARLKQQTTMPWKISWMSLCHFPRPIRPWTLYQWWTLF